MAASGARRRRVLAGCAALYGLFLVVTPFEHHDLLCHIKTPQHCTACTYSVVGSSPDTLPIPFAWHLADAGRPPGFHVPDNDVLLGVRSTGRSPPDRA
jgi:hypothetical protein